MLAERKSQSTTNNLSAMTTPIGPGKEQIKIPLADIYVWPLEPPSFRRLKSS